MRDALRQAQGLEQALPVQCTVRFDSLADPRPVDCEALSPTEGFKALSLAECRVQRRRCPRSGRLIRRRNAERRTPSIEGRRSRSASTFCPSVDGSELWVHGLTHTREPRGKHAEGATVLDSACDAAYARALRGWGRRPGRQQCGSEVLLQLHVMSGHPCTSSGVPDALDVSATRDTPYARERARAEQGAASGPPVPRVLHISRCASRC